MSPKNNLSQSGRIEHLAGVIFSVIIIFILGVSSYAYFSPKDRSANIEDGPIVTVLTPPAPEIIKNTPPPAPVPSPKPSSTSGANSIGLKLYPDLSWKAGRINGYVDIPAKNLETWLNITSPTNTKTKSVGGTYYYAFRVHNPPRRASERASAQKETLEYFARELKNLGFSRRGPIETLATLDDDYIRVEGNTARAVSVHVSAEFNTNCPTSERTIVGEICSPLSMTNEIYSIFISDPFTPSW